MVCPASVSVEVVSTSSCGSPMYPLRSGLLSPRLSLPSQSPSVTTLAPPALVVPSPPPLPVHSTSPSSQATWSHQFLLAPLTIS